MSPWGTKDVELEPPSECSLTPTSSTPFATNYATETDKLFPSGDYSYPAAASQAISSPAFFVDQIVSSQFGNNTSFAEPNQTPTTYTFVPQSEEIELAYDPAWSPAQNLGLDSAEFQGSATSESTTDDEMDFEIDTGSHVIEEPLKGCYRDGALVLSMVTVWEMKKITPQETKMVQHLDITVGCMTEDVVHKVFKEGATFSEVTMRFLDGEKSKTEKSLVNWVKFIIGLSKKIKVLRIIYTQGHEMLELPEYYIEYKLKYEEYEKALRDWNIQETKRKFWGPEEAREEEERAQIKKNWEEWDRKRKAGLTSIFNSREPKRPFATYGKRTKPKMWYQEGSEPFDWSKDTKEEVETAKPKEPIRPLNLFEYLDGCLRGTSRGLFSVEYKDVLNRQKMMRHPKGTGPLIRKWEAIVRSEKQVTFFAVEDGIISFM